MHLITYIFQFLDQSIHMVLRYSHFTVISSIITYTVIRCKAFGTKTVLIKTSFRKIIWKSSSEFSLYMYEFPTAFSHTQNRFSGSAYLSSHLTITVTAAVSISTTKMLYLAPIQNFHWNPYKYIVKYVAPFL